MSWLRGIAAFLAIAILANLATVAALPRLINAYAMHKIASAAGGTNRALASPRPDASARTIVRLSPDLLYTACVFDVSVQPLRITAPLPGSYASISGFAANTDNFFAVNDASVVAGPDGEKRLDVVLARSADVEAPVDSRLVVAPSARGVILFRLLITRDEDLPRLREYQALQRCEPFSDAR
ncbi:MAG TPA: DUF1254 domain-containing protein [Verrucomicrobiae bacterium]|nr:DUF1254 domain-containing protein [Verrucomicrobiae bacterium]